MNRVLKNNGKNVVERSDKIASCPYQLTKEQQDTRFMDDLKFATDQLQSEESSQVAGRSGALGVTIRPYKRVAGRGLCLAL